MRLYPDRRIFYSVSAVVFISGAISSLLLAYLFILDKNSNTYDVVNMGIIFWPFVGGLSGACYFLSNLKNIIDMGGDDVRIQRRSSHTEFNIPAGEVMLARNVMLVGSVLVHLRIGDRWTCYRDENSRPVSFEFLESMGVKKKNELSIFISLVKQGSISSMLFIVWALVGGYLFVFGLP
ncbi:MAG TPA: hypothetical protein ENJ35_10005 [Gammaproteobacteria bacterium]|nr:hypothetical protein [Gammaproteobacteria bacterium]